MPNPTCTVNSATAPADVTASSTVTIALASSAGANFWSIQATGTDETNTPAAINATLVVNLGAKTATFTAPALGSAVIFTSTVGVTGLGLDINGVQQPSYTTTFKVNVKTSAGFRVLAAGEQLEQDALNGWIAEINAGLRALT